MIDRFTILLRSAALAAALALAACQGADEEAELASLDNQLTGNDSDPALTSALEDQILVDPALQQQANRNAIRPADMPVQAEYPLPQAGGTAAAATGAATAQPRQGAASAGPAPAGRGAFTDARSSLGPDSGGACGGPFDHDVAWARRLPAAFPVYPGGRVTEAAGNQSCRVVTFATEADWQRVLDWYHTRAVRSGFSSEHQIRQGDHVLAGVDGKGGAAFYLIVTPTRTGADVALIASKDG